MPKPPLQEPYASLASDMIDTMLAGLKEWRPDLSYPESHSDMQGCVRAVLRMFEVKRRPIALSELPIDCDLCHGKKHLMALEDGKLDHLREVSCPRCCRDDYNRARAMSGDKQ